MSLLIELARQYWYVAVRNGKQHALICGPFGSEEECQSYDKANRILLVSVAEEVDPLGDAL